MTMKGEWKKDMTTLNVKLKKKKKNDGFERQAENSMMALNVKLEINDDSDAKLKIRL